MAFPTDAPQAQEKGIFKHPKLGQDLPDISGELTNVGTRMRILEERYTNLRRKVDVIEQNMLTNNRNLNTEIKTINSEINEVRREVELIRTKIKQIIAELSGFARKDDVKVIEKYVNLIDPTKYVTEREVENIVKRILEERE